MTRTDRSRRVDRSRADSFAEVGRRLIHAGRAIRSQGDARHASALAILAVHAVIAHADAVCVFTGGRKSTSADHDAALALLRSIMGNRLPAQATRDFAKVVAGKDKVEYQGYVVTMAEADRAFLAAERFGTWAERVLSGTD